MADFTYHVSIWDDPVPTYVCLLCNEARGLTLEQVTTHLREVHDADAIPTSNMDTLLALRTEANARAAAAEQAAQTLDAPPLEETPNGG